MAETGMRHALLAALPLAAAMAIPGPASAGEDDAVFVMPPVLQIQAANGLANEDVLRIVARENLMLTSIEAAQIEAALNSADITGDEPVAGAGSAVAHRYFRLDALLYFSPSSWSLWLNGTLVTPTSAPPDIRINAITPNYVEIVWVLDANAPDERRIFTLRPGQVYMTETDEVVDASKVAVTGSEVMSPQSIPIDGVVSETIEIEEYARPEELRLTREQIDQLRDLEDALKAQE